MITITNGQKTARVTKGAFHEMYEPMGWRISDSRKEKSSSEDLPKPVEKPSEIKEEDQISGSENVEYTAEDITDVQIPFSEMKVNDLKEFAQEHGIDVSAAKRRQDIIDIIRAEMEE